MNEIDDFSFLLIGGVLLIVIAFAVDWYDLHKFKKCYDINFQEKSCQKYINY